MRKFLILSLLWVGSAGAWVVVPESFPDVGLPSSYYFKDGTLPAVISLYKEVNGDFSSTLFELHKVTKVTPTAISADCAVYAFKGFQEERYRLEVTSYKVVIPKGDVVFARLLNAVRSKKGPEARRVSDLGGLCAVLEPEMRGVRKTLLTPKYRQNLPIKVGSTGITVRLKFDVSDEVVTPHVQ